MPRKLSMDNDMSNELVVKTNRLNEAMHNLSQQEMQLLALGIVRFRDNTTFDPTGVVIIRASDYAEVFKVNRVTAHQALLDAEQNLFKRQFTIVNANGNTVKSRWISHVEYLTGENAIKIALSPVVVEHISQIDPKENPFTQYHIEQIGKFNSRYATRLYELLKQWVLAKKTPVFELKKFRFQLGLMPNEYEKLSNFKLKVLDVAVNEINAKSDICVSYTVKKQGRKVVGYQFFVSEKPKAKVIDGECKQIDPKQQDSFNGLTDAQLARIVNSKKFINDYNHLVSQGNPANQSLSAWISYMVAQIKKDPSKFNKHTPKEYLDDEQAIIFKKGH
jgi:plasmid replication initiation protein